MPTEPERNGIVILVVDGDVVARNLIATAAAPRWYTVLAAAHGKEALELSATYKRRIDLLITDIDVPGVDGLAFVRRDAAREA